MTVGVTITDMHAWERQLTPAAADACFARAAKLNVSGTELAAPLFTV